MAKQISKEFFYWHRFKLVQFQTRFGNIEWILTDAEQMVDDLPKVIGQYETRDQAVVRMYQIEASDLAASC